MVLGNFDPEYLQLPEEVLVTVMRDHQKYFAVENAAGKLEPYFLAVLNTHPEEMGDRRDPARARAGAAGALQRRALLLDGGSEDCRWKTGWRCCRR